MTTSVTLTGLYKEHFQGNHLPSDADKKSYLIAEAFHKLMRDQPKQSCCSGFAERRWEKRLYKLTVECSNVMDKLDEKAFSIASVVIKSPQLSTITIKDISCNPFILSERSGLLKEGFSIDFNPSKLELPFPLNQSNQYDAGTISILKYWHGSDLTLTAENIWSVWEISHYLQDEVLHQDCNAWIAMNKTRLIKSMEWMPFLWKLLDHDELKLVGAVLSLGFEIGAFSASDKQNIARYLIDKWEIAHNMKNSMDGVNYEECQATYEDWFKQYFSELITPHNYLLILGKSAKFTDRFIEKRIFEEVLNARLIPGDKKNSVEEYLEAVVQMLYVYCRDNKEIKYLKLHFPLHLVEATWSYEKALEDLCKRIRNIASDIESIEIPYYANEEDKEVVQAVFPKARVHKLGEIAHKKH